MGLGHLLPGSRVGLLYLVAPQGRESTLSPRAKGSSSTCMAAPLRQFTEEPVLPLIEQVFQPPSPVPVRAGFALFSGPIHPQLPMLTAQNMIAVANRRAAFRLGNRGLGSALLQWEARGVGTGRPK